ncbi:MAG: VanZ family protein, partial [Acidobacteriota bacterium]
LYGVIDEVHQYFVPGRHATAHDVAADAAGALLALLAIAYRSRPGRDRRDRAITPCSPRDLGR